MRSSRRVEGQPNLHELGMFVRERRRTLGLTQTQLGNRMAWTQERISLLEHAGYGLPSLIILSRMAHALECDLAELITVLGF